MGPPDRRNGRPLPENARSKMLARRCIRAHRSGWCCQRPAPSTFGLSDREIWAEAKRLVELGFSLEEVRAVLQLPEKIA